MRVVGISQAHIGEGPNEDAIGWNELKTLAFVADGVGGSAKGEVASGLVKQVFEAAAARTDLKQLALTAHAKIREAAADKPESTGMASTLVAAGPDDRSSGRLPRSWWASAPVSGCGCCSTAPTR